MGEEEREELLAFWLEEGCPRNGYFSVTEGQGAGRKGKVEQNQ